MHEYTFVNTVFKKVFFGFVPPIMAAFLLAGCTGGSTPTPPTQIPTAIEYMGNSAGGEAWVWTSMEAGIGLKNADGDTITADLDPSDFTIELCTIDGTCPDDSSLGTASISGSQIVYTAPETFHNADSYVDINVYYNADLLGTQRVRNVVYPEYTSPTVNRYSCSDTSDPLLSYSRGADIAVTDRSVPYVCYADSGGAVKLMAGTVAASGGSETISWGDPVTVYEETAPVTVTSCVIAIDSAGRLAASWETSDKNIRLAYGDSIDSFPADSVITVNNNVSNAADHSTAYDGEGTLHVVYREQVDPANMETDNVYYTSCSSRTCEGSIRVNTQANTVVNQSGPEIAPDSTGSNVYVTWLGAEDGDWNVYRGLLSGGVVDSNTQASSGAPNGGPNIILDRNGKWAMAWNNQMAGTLTELLGLEDYGNITLFEGSAGTQDWRTTGLMADSSNTFHVVYKDGDLYLAMTYLSDDAWQTTTRVAVGSEVGPVRSRRVVSDDAGRTYIIWTEYTDEDGDGVYALGESYLSFCTIVGR